MKASELKVGDRISTGSVQELLSSPQPDRVIIKIWDDETQQVRFLNLFRDSEVNADKIYIDRGAILNEFMERLRDRLEYGARTHGEFWQGNDPSRDIEEELLDALVYLWIQRRLSKPVVASQPFDYKLGDAVYVKAGTIRGEGKFIQKRGQNSVGQDGYVIQFADGSIYTAVKSELSIIPKEATLSEVMAATQVYREARNNEPTLKQKLDDENMTFSGIIDIEEPFDFGGDT